MTRYGLILQAGWIEEDGRVASSFHLASLFVLALPVFAEPQAEAYARQLNELDKADPHSVCTARTSLRVSMPGAGAEQRAAMFRAFRAFCLKAPLNTHQAFHKQMDRFTSDTETWLAQSKAADPYEELLTKRGDIRQAGASWFDCGFSFYDSEGSLYPTLDPKTLLEFADELPPDLQRYVRFRAAEDVQPVMQDATLQLSVEQLRLRLTRWEDFARGYPQLPETRSEVLREIQRLASAYLFGSDNTPIDDLRRGPLRTEVLASWRTFATQNESSRYHGLVVALLARLEKTNQTLTEAYRPLFEQYGFQKKFDSWLRQHSAH